MVIPSHSSRPREVLQITMHHKVVLNIFYATYSWILLLKLKSVGCSDPLAREHDDYRGVPAAGSPMRSTFSQVSPRLEPFFDFFDFLRLSGVSAAARHRLGSSSLLRTDLMRKKGGKKDPFSQIKMWEISLIPLAQ